mgnify:CR=1 FL=1
MRALLIEVDFKTGARAGGISPRDSGLPCYGWQNLEIEPGLEIRLVLEDGRDLSMYKGQKGITILEGKDVINAAITANIPVRYAIQSETFMLESMKEKGLKLKDFASKSMKEIAIMAFAEGLAGVIERKPKLLE